MRLAPLRWTLLSAVFSLSAFADRPTDPDFHVIAARPLARLIESGWQTIDGIPLLEWRAALPRVYFTFGGIMFPALDRYRDDASYTDNGFVALNPRRWFRLPADVQSGLLLHESLGALGIREDRNYEISVQIAFLNGLPADAAATCVSSDANFDSVRRRDAYAAWMANRGGSGSGVQGGGDASAFAFKLRLLQLAHAKGVDCALWREIVAMRIEGTDIPYSAQIVKIGDAYVVDRTFVGYFLLSGPTDAPGKDAALTAMLETMSASFGTARVSAP